MQIARTSTLTQVNDNSNQTALINESKKQKQNLKTVEGSPIVKYKKMEKKNLFSLYDRVYEKYRSEFSQYENSFNLPQKAPDLFLSNNIHNNSHLQPLNFENNSNNNEFTHNNVDQRLKWNPKLKDSFVDMTSKQKNIEIGKTQPYEFEDFKHKSLEYAGPLNRTYFNQEFLMLNSILSQLFISNSLQKQSSKNNTNNNNNSNSINNINNNNFSSKKKYRLAEVNVNAFDFHDEYKQEFLKAKEELLLKEAANFIANYVITKKTKLAAQAGKFREIPQNNFFENFLNKIIRKVEVRKDNNELVSVEHIVNMIREEIEANNINPLSLHNERKSYEDCASQDNNNYLLSKSSFLPPIYSKPMSVLNEEDRKVPFMDYEMVANVKRLDKKKNKNKKGKGYGSDSEGNFDSDSDGDGDDDINNDSGKNVRGRYVKDRNGNWVFQEYKAGEKNLHKNTKRRSKSKNEFYDDFDIADEDSSFNNYNGNNNFSEEDFLNSNKNTNNNSNNNNNNKSKNNHNEINKQHNRNTKHNNTRKQRGSVGALKDISEEEANKNHSENEIETQNNKRKKRKNKFLEKIKNQQSPKSEFEFKQYFTDENNADMRKSFNLHMKFQKTHFNFLNKIDTFFLTTHSSGFGDLGQTLGPLGYNYRKKLNELLKKTKDNIKNNSSVSNNINNRGRFYFEFFYLCEIFF